MPNDKTYICKEDLLEKMQYRLPVEDDISEAISNCARIARRLVEMAPAVEVVPVAHGHWIPQYEYDFEACIDRVTGYTCSRCGKWSAEAGEECPNCHARMGGVVDGK